MQYASLSNTIRWRLFPCALMLLLIAAGGPGCKTDPGDDGSNNNNNNNATLPEDLAGWWVVEQFQTAGERYGVGLAQLNANREVHWEITFADGETVAFDDDVVHPATGSNLTASLPSGEATLYWVSHFEQSDTGAYQRLGDDRVIVFANDLGLAGTTGVFSPLDSAGYWPEDDRYKAYSNGPDDPRLSDIGLTAYRFDDGARMYACFLDWDNDIENCDVLERLPAAPDSGGLDGVWLGKESRYDNLPEWFFAVIVEHNGILYIHDRDESFLDSLFNPVLRAVKTTVDGQTEYIDTDQESAVSADWHARVTPDGVWLFGEYDVGDPEIRQYYAMQRIAEPPVGFLTGPGDTLSADWFDAPGTGPVPVAGTAAITQDGTRLYVEDQSEDGNTYMIEAEWTGYQYEGYWYDAASPGATSPWRGQLIGDGWYLHGTWEKGEYSIALIDSILPEDLLNEASDGIVWSVDPFDHIAATFSSAVDDIAGTIERRFTETSAFTFVHGTGEQVRVELDRRLRPVQVTTESELAEVRFSWGAAGATSVDIEVDEGGTTQQASVDLPQTDQELFTLLLDFQNATGVDTTDTRDRIAANPGQLLDILHGTGPSIPLRFHDERLTHVMKDFMDDAWWDQYQELCTDVGGVGMAVGWAATLLFPGAVPVALGAFIIAATGVYVVGMLLKYRRQIFAFLKAWFPFYCDPCSIICFTGCFPF